MQRGRLLNGRRQFGGELALLLDTAQDGGLALGQASQIVQAAFNLAQLFFVQAARHLFAIARDKGNGIAVIEQGNRRRYLSPGQHQFSSNRVEYIG